MRIDIRVQVSQFLLTLGELGTKQAPFVVRDAVNATARDVAAGLKEEIARRFVTSPAGLRFLQSRVKVITPNTPLGRIYAQGRDLRLGALVGVVPPEGKGQFAGFDRYRGLLLPMMEAGGLTPGPRDVAGRLGFGRYAIPIVRPGMRPRMPLNLWPINLGLQARQSIEGRRTVAQIKGKRRTYVVQMRAGEAIIFQRFGRERDDTTPLFATKQQTRLPARRFFLPTAQRIARVRLSHHLDASLSHALFGRGTYRG